MLLGDLGADIIKVETPGEGDTVRHQGAGRDGLSWYFANYNRNKRSITLNLRSDEGRDILARLIAKSDVLIDNYRPGVLDAMGFDEARLHEINPRLVRGSITGFGNTGPYRDRPSFDFIAQAMSGFMSVNGRGGSAADAVRPAGERSGCRPLRRSWHRRRSAARGAERRGRFRLGQPDGRIDQLSGLHGDRLSGDRPAAAAHRQRPSDRLAVRAVPHRRWRDRHRAGGRGDVPAPAARARRRGAARAPGIRHQHAACRESRGDQRGDRGSHDARDQRALDPRAERRGRAVLVGDEPGTGVRRSAGGRSAGGGDGGASGSWRRCRCSGPRCISMVRRCRFAVPRRNLASTMRRCSEN